MKKIMAVLPAALTAALILSPAAYALEAFQKRGFFVGFILSVWRVLRCNPFCQGGYDPVPEKGFKTMGRGICETAEEEDLGDNE